MEIDIAIKNYRCFQEPVRISLRKGFTGFVGVNNSGKSSLLKFFSEFRNLFANLSDRTTLQNAIRNTHHGFSLQFVYETDEVFCNSNDQNIEIWFFITPDENDKVSLTPKHIVVTVDRERLAWSLQLFMQDGKLESNGTEEIRDATFELFVNGAIRARLKEFADIVRALSKSVYIGPFRNAINVGRNDAYFDIKIGQAFIQEWRSYKTGPNSKQNEATYKLTKDIERIFSFKNLEINPSPDDQTLQTFINGKSYKLQSLGAGIAQFIVVLATAAIKKPAYIFIDEPELNLHPTLQLDFLTTLASYARDGIWFASHNIGLARSTADPDQLYSVRKIGEGSSEVVKFEKTTSLAEFVGELSFSAYADLGYDQVLLVEGRTEVKTIQEFLRLLDKNHRIVLIPMGGDEFLNGQCEDELKELSRISKNISVLIDSERAAEGVALEAKRQAFVDICKRLHIQCHALDRRATENYFPEHVIKKVIGPKHQALGYFERLDDAPLRWNKRRNWQIAREMKKEDLNGTDLGDFLESL